MPPNFRLLIVALLAGGIVLVAEELRISALRQSPIESAAPVESQPKDETELATLRERNAALVAESEQLRARIAGNKDAAPADAAAREEGEKSGKGGLLGGIAKLLADPEMKKLMRTQQAAGTRMMYGDLAKELGLSTEQSDKLLELLTARQNAASDLALSSASGGTPDAAKTTELADYDAKIKALLGPEKAAQLNEYERTTGDRMAMRQYERSFERAGQALDDKQSTSLLQIMKEERMKVPASPLEAGGKNPLAAMSALQDGAALEQSIQAQRELQQRVLARAHTILTPDQMTTFEASQKQQLQMQETGVKWGKALFGGGK
ncbi:MAG: hypothetical protein K8R23_09925 [Chthoniobacter sp.]|nr:hypothetical protein [Chthoniobacter sp.]